MTRNKNEKHTPRCYGVLPRILPVWCAISLGIDPIINALNKPAACPFLLWLLLLARLSPLETFGNTANVVVVAPLKTTPTGIPVFIAPLLVITPLYHLVALVVILEAVIIIFRDVETFTLANFSTMLLGTVRMLLYSILLILFPLSTLLVVGGLGLGFRAKPDITHVVR